MISKRFANRHFTGDDGTRLVGKCLYTMVVEGAELMESLQNLFATKKSFIKDVKLLETDIWLNLSAGLINNNLATIVATDIHSISCTFFI